MRKAFFAILAIVPLLAVVTYAAECLSFQPSAESFGYSSEEFGGSSYLGVDTRNVTADRLGALNLKEERGVEVTMVDQDAPAGKAGVKEHDVILSINGSEVESVEALRRMIRETPPGRVVTLGISRNGQPVSIKVQLADRKKAFGYAFPNSEDFKFTMPAMPAMPALPAMPDIDIPVSVVVVHSSRRSGLMVENLTPQLGEFFGVKNGQGVLIRSVEKGSHAEQAGLRAGDVITKINGQAISDASDFSHALRSRKDAANTVTLGIIRDKKEQTVTLTLPERKQSSVFEESFEFPEIDAEAEIDLSELNSEMAKLRPQIELAVREANRVVVKVKKSLCNNGKELHQQQQELKKHQQELQKRQKGLHKQLLDQRQELRQHMQDEQQELRREIRLELRGLSEI